MSSRKERRKLKASRKISKSVESLNKPAQTQKPEQISNVRPGSAFINAAEGKGWDLHWLRVERWGWFWSKAIYEFSLVYPDALTWHDGLGGYWRPDQLESETDLGSIPPPLRGIISHDRFIIPFCFHDSAWKHGGLWWATSIEGPYQFVAMSTSTANDMLMMWIYDRGGRFVRYPIRVGVWIGRLLRGKT